jgi:hypothetical protein
MTTSCCKLRVEHYEADSDCRKGHCTMASTITHRADVFEFPRRALSGPLTSRFSVFRMVNGVCVYARAHSCGTRRVEVAFKGVCVCCTQVRVRPCVVCVWCVCSCVWARGRRRWRARAHARVHRWQEEWIAPCVLLYLI